MPSWKLHREIVEKLQREVEGFVVWTPGLIDRVDRIIDKEYGEHDLGRGRDPESFYKLLIALWIEFGDVYDTLSEKFLRTDRYVRLKWKDIFLWNPEHARRYLAYVPDDCMILVLLHHILDLAMDYLLNNCVSEEKSSSMLEYACQEMKQYEIHLRELRSMDGRPFTEVLKWLCEILTERSRQLHALFVNELRSKGLGPGYGSKALTRVLSRYVNKKGYYGIINVNGKWLPIAAAATVIFNKLRKGESVTLGFSRYRGPYIHEELKLQSFRELVDKLSEDPCAP